TCYSVCWSTCFAFASSLPAGQSTFPAGFGLLPPVLFDFFTGRVTPRSVAVLGPFVELVASAHPPPKPRGDQRPRQLLCTRRDQPRELMIWDEPVGQVVRRP